MNQSLPIGKIIIAGSGPGDPELLTIKAATALQEADVILTDRLVSEEILLRYANPKAEIIKVGKQCRRGISTPQNSINQLLIEHALQGKKVVRLKGGDVSIFSNILDELLYIKKYNIPFEIIPGITAALGAAAYAGIPLTARNYSTAVRLLTFYKSTVVSKEYWKELAETNDTLVFYMSSETLDDVVQHLISHNISPDKHLAVIEQATTPYQQVYISNIYHYQDSLKNKEFLSPSLIIIGKVVTLHQQFSWFKNNITKDYYFKPLTKPSATFQQ